MLPQDKGEYPDGRDAGMAERIWSFRSLPEYTNLENSHCWAMWNSSKCNSLGFWIEASLHKQMNKAMITGVHLSFNPSALSWGWWWCWQFQSSNIILVFPVTSPSWSCLRLLTWSQFTWIRKTPISQDTPRICKIVKHATKKTKYTFHSTTKNQWKDKYVYMLLHKFYFLRSAMRLILCNPIFMLVTSLKIL